MRFPTLRLALQIEGLAEAERGIVRAPIAGLYSIRATIRG